MGQPYHVLNPDQLTKMIDHTQVRAYATQPDIDKLCDEAKHFGFACVTVNPAWTSYCAKRLAGTQVGINPTIGFPLGATTANMKLQEAKEAVKNGATELDVVMNIGALKSGFPQYVEEEIAAIVKESPNTPVKVILETSYLDDDQKIAVCKLSQRAGAAFVKTSTGFGGAGATVADVKLLRQVVGEALGVKAAGGIRGYLDTVALIRAGASRVGTSAGLKILAEFPDHRASA